MKIGKEIMYVAYFNGGLRVVDISGELVGDLYRQGREIAKFYSSTLRVMCRTHPSYGGHSLTKASFSFPIFIAGSGRCGW